MGRTHLRWGIDKLAALLEMVYGFDFSRLMESYTVESPIKSYPRIDPDEKYRRRKGVLSQGIGVFL